MVVKIWLQFMGKKNEINPSIVSELQISCCHGIANLADCTQVIQSDRGIVGENVCILGNRHAQVSLSSRCVGVGVWGFASKSRRLVLPATGGLVESGLPLSEGSRRGPERQICHWRKIWISRGAEKHFKPGFPKWQNGLLPPKEKMHV